MLEDLLLRRNLIDAGFDEKQIAAFLDAKSPKSRLKLLEEKRAHLLDCIHLREKELDCLDFLIDEIGRRADH